MHDRLAVNVINCCHTQLSIESDQLNVFVVCDQELIASGRRGRPQAGPASEDPANFMCTLQAMAYAMREQATTAHQMMDQLGRQLEEGHGGNPNWPEVNFVRLKFVEFKKENPPSLWGTFNPNKANKWKKAIEKIFSVLACTEYQKVVFATYILEADVEFWWTCVKSLLECSQTDIIWEIFKKAFYYKYFPASIRNSKELEFLQLQQGGRSVQEYIAKFEELCKFSTICQQNPDEAWKYVKFEGGLREDILAVVRPMEIRDFTNLVNKCRLVTRS